jgi:hypothetical protein
MEIRANICSRKLLAVAKVNKNIQPGNAELERKGVKCANVKFILSDVSPEG